MWDSLVPIAEIYKSMKLINEVMASAFMMIIAVYGHQFLRVFFFFRISYSSFLEVKLWKRPLKGYLQSIGNTAMSSIVRNAWSIYFSCQRRKIQISSADSFRGYAGGLDTLSNSETNPILQKVRSCSTSNWTKTH